MLRRTMLFMALLCLLATATVAQTPPYTKTIIVGDTLNPVLNGSNLLAAVATPGTPGPGDRWLVFIEPGTYDLGAATLVMRDFVDVVGSGRNSTHVTSQAPVTVVAPTGIDVELRELTVENEAGLGNTGTGILIETEEFKLTLVNVEVQNVADGTGIEIQAPAGRPRLSAVFPRIAATDNATGLRVTGDGVVITEMFVFILSASANANIGLLIAGSGESIVEGVSGFVAGAQALNAGLDIIDSSPRVTNNQWVADGLGVPGVRTAGLFVSSPGATVTEPLVRESIFVGQNSPNFALGAWVSDDARLIIQHSLLRGLGGTGIGLGLRNSAFAEVDQCVIDGVGSSLRTSAASTLEIGASKVDGPRVVGGASTCVQSYDGAYTPIPFGPC